ncbi:MAG: phosphatidylcholine synthase [Planctomycetes bacterium]|nr:phosphatidylcholine synthase [Planctomycetota bacterium]
MRAYLVHVYTASGVAFALLAVVELLSDAPDARRMFAWLAAAVFVDATDGALARACHVKTRVPHIDGRTIDDIVDYLTFTFVPLLAVWRLGWLPGGTEAAALAWIVPAMMASLLGFANTGAKDEQQGFFLGFPSYWNLFAFYAGWWSTHGLVGLSAALLVAFTILTVLPVRFVYPSLAPHPWRMPVLVGAAVWTLAVIAMLPAYPDISATLVWLSISYPAAYAALSMYLDVAARRRGS